MGTLTKNEITTIISSLVAQRLVLTFAHNVLLPFIKMEWDETMLHRWYLIDRVDPMDRGAEYRSLIGLPGGVKHTSYGAVKKSAENAGFQLVEGKGNDGDTLGKQIVYVYDSTKFPFYQAEVYHQYHNDFQSPAYGKAYNELADVALDDGRLKGTGCPDRI